MTEVFQEPPREVAEAVERFLDESHIVTHARTPGSDGTGKGQLTRRRMYGDPGWLPLFFNGGESYHDHISENADKFLNVSDPRGFSRGSGGIDFDFFGGMPMNRPIELARQVFIPDESPFDKVIVNRGYQVNNPRSTSRTQPSWASSPAEYYRSGNVVMGAVSKIINVRPALLTPSDGSELDCFTPVPETGRELRLGQSTGTTHIRTIQPSGGHKHATVEDAKIPGLSSDRENLAFTRWQSGGNMYKFLTSMNSAADLFRGYGDENEVMAPIAVAALLKELIARHNGGLVYFHSEAYWPTVLDFQAADYVDVRKTQLELT